MIFLHSTTDWGIRRRKQRKNPPEGDIEGSIIELQVWIAKGSLNKSLWNYHFECAWASPMDADNTILCSNPSCPNRGMLVLDTNFVFFLIEGVIRYVEGRSRQNSTNSERLPDVLSELDSLLTRMKTSCSQDGTLHTTEMVFVEEMSILNREGLTGLSKLRNQERGQILSVVDSHLPNKVTVPDEHIAIISRMFKEHRPNRDRDASLLVMACNLASNGGKSVILSTDPDFDHPILQLVRHGTISFPHGQTLSITGLIKRGFINFLTEYHDCCNLSPDLYRALADSFLQAQIVRIPKLTKKRTQIRVGQDISELLEVHSLSLQYKGGN